VVLGCGRRRRRWQWWGAEVTGAATVVSPDSVSIVADPGVALQAPSDGRPRGDHLAASVTGVAWPARVGSGSSARQAAPGQRLVVFGLQGAHLGQTLDSHGNRIPPVTGTLVVDGGRERLPTPERDDGSAPVFYLASVTATAAAVAVEVPPPVWRSSSPSSPAPGCASSPPCCPGTGSPPSPSTS
jgi:hypothetical protein